MAMRGIDAQVMINRSLEAGAEQHRNARLHDVNQANLAQMGRVEEQARRGRSQSVSKTENMVIRGDEKRKRQEGEPGGEKREAEENQAKTLSNDFLLSAGRRDEYRIDIQI